MPLGTLPPPYQPLPNDPPPPYSLLDLAASHRYLSESFEGSEGSPYLNQLHPLYESGYEANSES